MRDPFYRLFETPADQGGDTAVDDNPVDGDVSLDDNEVEPQRYTMEELSEALGPRFAERFASKHEGLDAAREFARSYEEATGLIGRGGHLSPQDAQVYADLGIEAPEYEPEEEPVEQPQPLYGTPWAEPTSWPELVELAERNPRAAAEFALKRDDLPDNTKAWFFANWAAVDSAGAFAYNQQATTAAAQKYADEQVAAIRAQVDPLVHDRMVANGQVMLAHAKDSIPGFQENAQAVSDLLAERQLRDPKYHEWFLNATMQQQINELRDLTGVAIYRNQPAADQAAADELAAAEAEKARSQTEVRRTAGGQFAPAAPQSDMKKKNLADFARLQEQGQI